jgi:predicted nucleic acid-binding protein
VSYVVVDASIWVARLVPQDVFHDACKSWLTAQRAANVELVSPSLLLTEVAGAVSRRTGDAELAKRAVGQLNTLPGLRLVKMDDRLVQQAAQLAADLGLRGADSLYVAVASQLGIPLATLDDEQRQRAAKITEVELVAPE